MIRRAEKECNDPAMLAEFLNKAQVLHLAITVPGDAPYVLPLNFVYDNGYFYIHSAVEGRKIPLLQENPVVGFAVSEHLRIHVSEDNPCATGTRYKSVVGRAEVSLLEDGGSKSTALNLLMAKYTNLPSVEYKEKVLRKLLIIKLKVMEMAFKADLR